MTMVWLRHGETALNAARVMQPADTPLSARGLAQARAAAERLAALRPAAIVSSDLPRALQTAEALAALTGLPVHTEPLLQERNFGAWRGRPWDELGFDATTMEAAPEGGESLAAFLQRCDAAWAAMVSRRAAVGGPLVVVSHGLLIHAVLRRHARLDAGLTLPERLANTAVSEVDAAPPHRARRVGCVAHLAPLADP
ncbi:MAG: histidine phosphatase family protein [Rubrivivax sp.]